MAWFRNPIFAPAALLSVVVVGVLVIALGRSAPEASTQSAALSTERPGEEYPDAQRRALDAMARERRPVPNSALPPRHLDADRFSETLVDRNLIVSGGPPPDGIASIDDPGPANFSTVDQAVADGWLLDREPVAVVTVDGTARLYPLQVMVWHEIVNDTIDDSAGNPVPVAVTYCPLCNSVAAFERTVDLSGVAGLSGDDLSETVVDFGTSGSLYQSALVMYDRQTESLWTHFDGQAVVGDLLGSKLEHVSASIVSWADAQRSFAGTDTLVLTTATGQNSPYGESPYPNYLDADLPTIGFVTGEVDPRLPGKERVIGIERGDSFVAVPLSALVGPEPSVYEVDDSVVFWVPGTSSAIDGEEIAGGTDVGATGVFDAAGDSFAVVDTKIVDERTGSQWSILGRAISGEREGEQLAPVEHLDTFWFAWVRYHPETSLDG